MRLKKKPIRDSRLYLVIDKKTSLGKDPLSLARRAMGSGVDIVQLRDKESNREEVLKAALALRKLLAKGKTLFIINDYLDIAKIADADGVHLGQGDNSPQIARKILGKGKLIGVSCHTLRQALQAQKTGADYVSIGPVFATPLKPKIKNPVGLSLLKYASRRLRIPFFAIGGINATNINKILLSGAKRVALCRAVLKAPKTKPAIRQLCQALN